MKKIIYIIFFIIASFSLNILFYYFSDSYRGFLKDLKQNPKEQVVVNKNYDININKEAVNIVKNSSGSTNITSKKKSSSVYLQDLPELNMTKVEQDILDNFKEYNLKKIDLHPRLFDLSSEYPDEYYEYYSEYITMYFFGTKTYEDILDIFDTLTYELPFVINKVNNIGTKSFYINLKNDFQDDYVRIVFLYKSRIIGMKIKKSVYENIKLKLAKLK